MEAPIYHLEGVVKAKEENMEDFVGPLDLILHLLSKNKLEIKDIQISLILDQYMESPWLPTWCISKPGCCCPSTTRRP